MVNIGIYIIYVNMYSSGELYHVSVMTMYREKHRWMAWTTEMCELNQHMSLKTGQLSLPTSGD